RCTLG
ncbi:putative phosphate import ATP-binding protein PstB 2, partial [Vibrio parahaemolyticus VPTS-2010]